MAETKFSQFTNGSTIQNSDQIVGLRSGANTRFDASSIVIGPASATANAIARYNSTTGKLIKNSSGSTISDADLLTTVTLNVGNTTSSLGGIQFNGANFVSNYGTQNTFCGQSCGNTTLTTGSAINNSFYGYLCGSTVTTASGCSAFGAHCFDHITTGINNSAFGNGALELCTTGGGNAAFGNGALTNLISGGSNIAVGPSAGSAYTTSESSNICIGNPGTLGDSFITRIGSAQIECHIAGINGVSITNRAIVVCDTGVSDQLGTITILTSANGGTGNGFTKFTGATTSEKTYTLPNASDTISCLGQSNTFTKKQLVTPVAITSSSGSIATDASLSNIFTHTMTENTTLANPTNMSNGQELMFVLTQASSAKTLAFGNKFKFPGGSAMVISTGNAAVDIMFGVYLSTPDLIYITGFAQAIA